MTNFPTYGSITSITKRSYEVLSEDCVVTEKIHGTNCRLSWTSEGLYVGSRNKIIFKAGWDYVQYDGYGFFDWLKYHPFIDFCHNSPEFTNYTFYGEFFGPGIQKGISYGTRKDFKVFDIRDADDNFLGWEEVKRICKKVGFDTVPELFVGQPTVDQLNELVNLVSTVGKETGINDEENICEGIVIKPLNMRRDRRGEWMRYKYKNAKWSEVQKVKVKKIDPNKLKVVQDAEHFGSCVITYGRTQTIIEHITRDGNTELTMQRTPEFLSAIVKDVMKEFSEKYESLSKEEVKHYNKTLSQFALQQWKAEVEKRNAS